MTTTPTLRDAAQAVLREQLDIIDNLSREEFENDAAIVKHCSRAVQDLFAAIAAPADAPPTWPKDAAEVRAFMGVNFEVMKFGSEDQTPHDDDRYQLTAHDFLSAVDWWADHPHYLPAADALAEPMTPFGYWHQGATEEESDFFKHDDMGNVACEKCITLYAAPPAAQLQRAVARAIEECAAICDELETHYTDYASTALLNGDVALSNAASGEPRACRAIAAAIRAKDQP